MTARANILMEAFLEPMPGYRLMRVGAEYLIVAADDSTRNVLLDADIICQLLADLLDGSPRDDFGHGLGTMWRFESIAPMRVY